MKKHQALIFFLSLITVLGALMSACNPILSTFPPPGFTPKAYTSVVTVAGQPGVTGATNGTGTSATFNSPSRLAVDKSGNIYVSDFGNELIRKITPGGIVTTLAGQAGVTGSTDGIGTAATFDQPQGIAVDSSGNVFVADWDSCIIRKITPAGAVTTWAGQAGVPGSTNGLRTSATFSYPTDLAIDSSDNLFVVDSGSNVIRKITPSGNVSTFAGSGAIGNADGTGTAASFYFPTAISIDPSNDLYVMEPPVIVRKITPGAVVSSIPVGSVIYNGYVDGPVSIAQFGYGVDTVVDAWGNIYVSDDMYPAIRKVTPGGIVSSLMNSNGTENPTFVNTSLTQPVGLAMDASGHIFVADFGGNAIFEIK